MPSFRLASFNICSAHYQSGVFSQENLDRIAEKILLSEADVVALQEVDRATERSQGIELHEAIGEKSGLPYRYFIPFRAFRGGEYGMAILSRHPIRKAETVPLQTRLAKRGNVCGYCVLDVEGTPVTVFDAHLSCDSPEENTECLERLEAVLSQYRIQHGPFLCCGDFNASFEKVESFFPWAEFAHRGLFTYQNKSIDHILFTPPYRAGKTRILDTSSDRTSDHNMLITEITF